LVREWLAGPYWSRMRDWVGQVADLATRSTRRYPTIDAAAARMRAENPFLSEAQARHLTVHGVLRNEDGTFSWKFDNYMRPFLPSPATYSEHELEATFARITCPTLFVAGTSSWHGDPATDGRLAAFRCPYRNVVFEDAGHWLHHDQPALFMETLRQFLRDADAGRVP
jgi:pimeloyl-ACP methyl ester carboxylesterase